MGYILVLACAAACISAVCAAPGHKLRRHRELQRSWHSHASNENRSHSLHSHGRQGPELLQGHDDVRRSCDPILHDQPNFSARVKEAPLVFLHVGKTGGTNVKTRLRGRVDESVLLLGHNDSHHVLSRCQHYPEAKFGIFVRAPAHRFVSAWLSRYTKGAPDYYDEWSPEEAFAFKRFKSPDELACALKSQNYTTYKEARRAMKGIKHIHWDLHWYAGSQENFRRCLDNFVFVGRTEHFDYDMMKLYHLLDSKGLLRPLVQAAAVSKHASDPELDEFRLLGACAVNALRDWYFQDYEIIGKFVHHGLLHSTYIDEVASMDSPPAAGKSLYFREEHLQ